MPQTASMTCPECGKPIDALHLLYNQGLRARTALWLFVLLVAPSALLLVSTRMYLELAGGYMFVRLCLWLAPPVIGAHMYAMWNLISMTVVLSRRRMGQLKLLATVAAGLIDLASCLVVALWFG